MTRRSADKGSSSEKLIGGDDRIEVASTLRPPYSAICALDILWPDGSYELGTGYLCAERVLATVGHNLFDPSRGGRARKVGILPAVSHGTAPFGTAIVEDQDLRIYCEWMYGQEDRHDLAAIVLPQPLGRRTGWCALAAAPAFKPGDRFVVTGFPADKVTKWQDLRMMRGVGTIIEPLNGLVYYDADATGGQSGSPVWLETEGDAEVRIIGFHKGELVGRPTNLFVPLDQAHLQFFREVMRFLDSGIPVKTRAEAEVTDKRAFASAAGEGPPAEPGPLPPFHRIDRDETAGDAPAEAARRPGVGDKHAIRNEDFRIAAKGRQTIAVELGAGDVVAGKIRVALPAATFTDCDLVLKNPKGHDVDHLPMFVSSSGAKDFHSDRFSFAAEIDGIHHLVFRELNGVSAAVVQLAFKIS